MSAWLFTAFGALGLNVPSAAAAGHSTSRQPGIGGAVVSASTRDKPSTGRTGRTPHAAQSVVAGHGPFWSAKWTEGLRLAGATSRATAPEPGFKTFESPPASSSENLPGTTDDPSGYAYVKKTWAACGLFSSKNKLVRQFPRKYVSDNFESDDAELRCGNKKYGYRHIKGSHQLDWEAKAAYIGDNWRDLADFSIYGALRYPMKVVWDLDRDTYCFSRNIYLLDQDGDILNLFRARVAIGATGNRTLTAFPAGSQCSASGNKTVIYTHAE